MKLKIIASILFLSLFSSCFPSFKTPQRLKNEITFCYSGKPTGLDTLINLKGFYRQADIFWDRSGYGKSYKPKLDTTLINILFFNDGICIYQFGWYDQTGKEYLDSIAKILPKPEINAQLKGLYQVSGDTIRIQVINNSLLSAAPWYGVEFWYKIVDNKTIKEIGRKALVNNQNNRILLAKHELNNTLLAHFIPVDTLPPSDIWLKKQEWFWCKNRK